MEAYSRSGQCAAMVVVCAALAASACAGAAKHTAMPAAVAAGPRRVEQLSQSLFARDPQGQLTEEKIQSILGQPLELELPARVGVLPIVEAEDWRGPGPSYEMAPAGLGAFAVDLRSPEIFTLVSEMMPIPSGALGMEALREIAARYKLRYVVLYREHIRRHTRANGWAAGYATLVGALFLPGSTLHADGYVEASLFDVKTGLLLFTVRRRVSASQRSNVWHQEDKLALLQQRLAMKVAGKLAADVRGTTTRYAEAVGIENRRLASVPATDAAPGGGNTRTYSASEVDIAGQN